VTIGAGLSGLLLLCAAILLAVQVVRHPRPLQPPSERPGKPGSTAPNEETADDYSWIVQAMAECDAEAKQKLDKLQFLIVPLPVCLCRAGPHSRSAMSGDPGSC
jgi:hypothetical protein